MGRELPARGERFLYALSRNLTGVSSFERDAVLLELRSHLVDRAQQGEAALDAALGDLGDPVELAARFDQGDGEPLAPVPEAYAMPRRRMRVGEVLVEVRATFLASRDGLMMVGLVLATILSVASWLWWAKLRLFGPGIEEVIVMKVQYITVVLAHCAGFRIVLTDDRRPWRISAATLLFAVAFFVVGQIGLYAMLGVDFLFMSLAAMAALSDGAVTVGRSIWTGVSAAFGFWLTVRLQPWVVALAIDRRDFTIGASWRGSSGQFLNMLRGWLVLCVPLFLLANGLQTFALKGPPLGAGLLGLAILQGVALTCLALASILLHATIYRWAAGEPIPSPRPFATEPPDPLKVEEARERLAALLGPPRAERDAERRAKGLPQFAND